ncbi:MAG TPA: hypothetical protein VGG28_10525 [Kofleriaceae bacterium]|jgi:hypothetical protein
MMKAWIFALLAACGPVAYVNQVTLKADDAVDDARAAGAEKSSPYYWTRATQYLRMAHEVAGRADFQGANRFGRLAEEAAIKAKAEAEAHRDSPTPAPAPTPTVAPAKDPTTTAPAKDEP